MRSTLPQKAMDGAHFLGQNAYAHPSAGTVPCGVDSSPKLNPALAREPPHGGTHSTLPPRHTSSRVW